MKIKKRMIMIAMILVLALALGACGKKKEQAKQDPQPSQQGQTQSAQQGSQEQSAPASQEKKDDAQQGKAESKPAQSNTSKDQTIPRNDSVFKDFLAGNEKVGVFEAFASDVRMLGADYKTGTFMSIDELVKVCTSEMTEASKPQISWAPVEDSDSYVMSMVFTMGSEDFTQYYVISDSGKGLSLDFAIDGWSRRTPEINIHGVVKDFGSNGAASHSSAVWVPDKGGAYHLISETDEVGDGFSLYDKKGEPRTGINQVMEAVYADKSLPTDGLVFGVTVSEGKDYYYYSRPKLTAADVKAIDAVAAKSGFTFAGLGEIRKVVKANAAKYGAEEKMEAEKLIELKAQ